VGTVRIGAKGRARVRSKDARRRCLLSCWHPPTGRRQSQSESHSQRVSDCDCLLCFSLTVLAQYLERDYKIHWQGGGTRRGTQRTSRFGP